MDDRVGISGGLDAQYAEFARSIGVSVKQLRAWTAKTKFDADFLAQSGRRVSCAAVATFCEPVIKRFGELPEGSYTYMVLVTDSTGESLCFASDFTVSGSASSTQTYWSVKDAGGTKLQQTVKQMETTVETAAETTVSWFAQLFG